MEEQLPFPAVLVVSQATWSGMSEEERAAFTAAAEEALAWGTEQQVAAESANIASLDGQIEIGRVENGNEVFGTANAAFQEAYGSNDIISRFQEQAREAAQ